MVIRREQFDYVVALSCMQLLLTGVESPAAVQKMLSLVDHSRVRPVSLASPSTSPSPNQHPAGMLPPNYNQSPQPVPRRMGATSNLARRMSSGAGQSLTAECSSVTGGNAELRLSSTSELLLAVSFSWCRSSVSYGYISSWRIGCSKVQTRHTRYHQVSISIF